MSKATATHTTSPRLRIAAENGKRARGIKAPGRILPPVPRHVSERIDRAACSAEEAREAVRALCRGGYNDDPVITRALAKDVWGALEWVVTSLRALEAEMQDDPERFWR